ncbi:MAG TPA: alpha/beta fold hydrolase [Bryobacteraceae bacterium]|nr:alpha/beta fold hydrolase [Bryobacteraceae bacterium]
MSTVHRWFRSGVYSLLGHIDLPPTTRGPLGVLIVPPFGWEDLCCYRPLRFLARIFAAEGIPAMRFDLPGTGDSSGDARDSGLFDAWIQSVGDAAGELREASGVEDVAVMGIRTGAMVALAAAARGANVQDLILWGPAATGRAVLREFHAFCKMARTEYASSEPAPPQPIPGLEIGGFLIAPETQRALETLDLSKPLAMQGRRVLVLSREDLPVDQKLVSALESSGCTVVVSNGSGYRAMNSVPEEALPPIETGRAMIDFLTKASPEKEPDAGTTEAAAMPTSVIHHESGASFETIYTIEGPSGSIFGILSEPGPETLPNSPNEWCVLFLNPGAVRHIGPNRMWVEAARRWAARGVISLRLDLEGIGESDGEQNLDVAALYQERLVEQIEIVMDSLRSRLGVRRFVAIGLCSGAFWAFHAAIRNPDIRAAILLNPRLFFWDPEVDRRRILRRTAGLLMDRTDWRRLARGYFSLKSFKRVTRIVVDRFLAEHANAGRRFQICPEGMAHAWRALERNQNRLTLIFTEGEPLLREMEEEGHLPPHTGSPVRCIRIANCGHTFRPLWAQEMAHELIDSELEAVFSESRLDSGARRSLHAVRK